MMDVLYKRRSIRRYKGDQVSDEVVEHLLRAGMYAPSAGNERPWQFVVIRDRDKLEKIAAFHPFTQMLKEAPMAIVPCADQRDLKYDGDFWVQDLAACTQNILLQGTALGLGTCWCGIYPKVPYVEAMSDLLGLPEYMVPFSVIAVGYPAEEREVRERYNPDRVHYDQW
jgi:nitroreductase